MSDLLDQWVGEVTAYLAGPMSGHENFNEAAFREAAVVLREEHGMNVISPVELDDADGFDHSAGEITEAEYRDFLARDIAKILEARPHIMVVLPGWENSRGAAQEVHVAREVLGIPILAYPGLEEVKRPTSYRPPADESVLEEAQRLVHGDRGEDYGRPIEDFSRTAMIATAILSKKLIPGAVVEPQEIPLLMIGVKLSRLAETPTKRDSAVDIPGYAETFAMTMEDLGRPLR